MKLENCGRCGLEPVEMRLLVADHRDNNRKTYGCITHNRDHRAQYGLVAWEWNAAQFAFKTDRVNAAADRLVHASDYAKAVADAEELIDAQDAAARVRWAEMQKEELMDTNEPGREPTEPTDAELELVLDLYRAAKRLAGNKTLADVQAVIDATNEVPWSAMKRLSGARPVPDTPAPDEVVRLRAEVVEQSATIARQFELLKGVSNVLKGQAGETELWPHADLPEMATRLSARVAELEAALVSYIECGTGNSTDFDKQADAYRKAFNLFRILPAAPGKEPTSE